MVEHTFTDAHGVDIFTRWWAVEAPKAVVLVAHGASEHSGRYARFAAALNAAGYSVVAIDHRGHGETSKATGVGMMGAGGGDALVDDLHELRAQVDTPTFLFGHSMGSLIALAYLVKHAEGLSGAVLCGFPVGVDAAAETAAMLQGFADAGLSDAPAEGFLAANNAPFEPARTTYDWLSRDPAEVDAYIADPYCGDEHPLTWGYLQGLLGVVAPVRDQLDRITCPVFVIAGDQDPAAGMGEHPTHLAGLLPHADLKLYEGARHEILNETNRDEVTADTIAWLDSHLT